MDPLLSTIGPFLGEQFTHHQNLEENFNKLKRKWEELSSKREDIESRKKTELLPGKKLKKEVELWLGNVQKIDEERQNIENEVRNTGFFQRAGQGKRVVDKTQEIEELHQKGSCFDSLVVDAPPSKGEIIPTTTLVGETTTKRKMEDIWACLINNDVRQIGVYGMGGSGKTTTLMHINNRILQDPTVIFDKVIWLTVSKKSSVIKLQDKIAAAFSVPFSIHEDVTMRAAKLFAHLKGMKRCLLILDDVWNAIDLRELGIPEPALDNECKLLLTTRSYDVCRIMNCEAIKMELLSEDEAWGLFLDIVGHDMLHTPTLEPIMKSVAKECACLPLAIITIAGSMKDVVDECDWRNALEELKGSAIGLNDMGKVFKQLKYSFTRLKNEKLQDCLLYCALFPEDFEIKREKLIEYLIVEGIIEEKTTRQAYFDKGHAMLNKLENVCLLESCTAYSGEKCVKMHDLIRDMALQIKSHRFMVEAGVRLEEIPAEEKWTKDLERVSLMENAIRAMPFDASPRCPRLSTLLLSENGTLRRISDSFFAHMHRLKVLDLSRTRIDILPKSISDLESLTGLLLSNCESLRYVPSLAKLRLLKKLDLSYTGIEEVPHGMERLVNLRWLGLYAKNLKTLPAGILPKLNCLQYLIVCWDSMPLQQQWVEVAGLRKLETLVADCYDLRDLNAYVRSLHGQGPNNYSLIVGSDFTHGHDIRRKITLRRCSICRQEEDLLVLPNNIEMLVIEYCHDMSSLCDISSFNKAAPSLKSCEISKCNGIECVLSSSSPYFNPLQSLEVLDLYGLQNLQILINGDGTAVSTLPPGTFSSLKELYIYGCPNIKKLFSQRLLPQLRSLERIYVAFCRATEEIIAAAEGDQEAESSSNNLSAVNNVDVILTITIPKLRVLRLMWLPRLKSIIYGRVIMACDSLQRIELAGCRNLKRLPLSLPMPNGQLSAPPSLQCICIPRRETEWWESLEWDHPNTKDVLQPFLGFMD